MSKRITFLAMIARFPGDPWPQVHALASIFFKEFLTFIDYFFSEGFSFYILTEPIFIVHYVLCTVLGTSWSTL